MLQPTGGPQPVAQPFSRSQLPRLAFFMVTLAALAVFVLKSAGHASAGADAWGSSACRATLARGAHRRLEMPAVLDPLCKQPQILEEELSQHGCVMEHKVCVDHGRFTLFAEKLRPRTHFDTGLNLFEAAEQTQYNLPGYLDNVPVSCAHS